MKSRIVGLVVALVCAALGSLAAAEGVLPAGVKAVWDSGKAYRESTPTRERLSINGLWQWQPAQSPGDAVPTANWGYFKVPGCWPGKTDYMQKDCQTLFSHPSWKGTSLGAISQAWYQRDIEVPQQWQGRRVVLALEYLNSFATVYVDGRNAGEIAFPAGELDLTAQCPPGSRHVLSLRVVAKPLHELMLKFSDTNSARRTRAEVARRGLCGDAWLISRPAGPAIADVKVDTSFRKGQIALTTALANLAAGSRYTLHAVVTEKGQPVKEFDGPAFAADDLKNGRFVLTEKWKPERLWDIHTPQNQCEVAVTLRDETARPLDVGLPVRFGFREFWIDGRDFYLNGTRIYLSALPIDNAQISAASAGYAGAKETLLRLKAIGINFVYTHNYGCEPGSHLGFEELLRAADDVGVLVSFSQPHFAQYEWQAADAAEKNGYAQHAKFYVRVAGSHPAVVFYSMSHNSTGYDEDMNPDLIDGIHAVRNQWSVNNLKRAQQAEAIVTSLDPRRIVYHHSSGNLGPMHNTNFYTNMAPIQELDDWFEHWATEGVKPMFTCEYMVPCTWDWTMYRGWYKGVREFGSAPVPWEFCVAEWSAQTVGDRAYQIGEPEKRNIRWEAEQFRNHRLWHRWDYPFQVGSPVFDVQHEIIGKYLTSNWRAYRTWGVSATSPWEYHFFWRLRDGADRRRKELAVDWENLQRPGFSADYLGEQMDRMDVGYERSDWLPTADGQAILRNNQPLLAYLAGKQAAFTSKDHNFYPGEIVEKQIVVINNSRETVTADCRWHLNWKSGGHNGVHNPVNVETGKQTRIARSVTLPETVARGTYPFKLTAKFSTGETQDDEFAIHVMPRPVVKPLAAKIALFDPKGETAALLAGMKIEAQKIEAGSDLTGYDILVIGKGALTLDGPCPDVGRVAGGLKVIVFEQQADVLERRLGFRIAEYGLRQVFPRVPDHPILAGIDSENLRDWRGEATNVPPRLKYHKSDKFGGPAVTWCGIEVPHVWRCGNRGNVASVLIEKPAMGDFLPIVDGGYSLQYSPLLEYHEGRGMVMFCQLDVTGRTEHDPAAETLVANLVKYTADWKPKAWRKALYCGGPAGRHHLQLSCIPVKEYGKGLLMPDEVLIFAPSVKDSARLLNSDCLDAGGYVVALGLDKRGVLTHLPVATSMVVTIRPAEHIASYFEPQGLVSPFVGIGPADVHNRAPWQVNLIYEGPKVLADGVLANAQNGHVVFYQQPPHLVKQLDFNNIDGKETQNVRRTYRRASYTLARLLANLGVAAKTPLLENLRRPVTEADSKSPRVTFSFYVDLPEEWDDPYRFFRW